DIAQDLFRFEIIPQSVEALQQLLSQMRLETTRSFASELDEQPPQQAGQEQQPRPEPVVVGPKVGRNDPCPCGSGKKYKKCCGQGSEDFE
ncbi:MAG: SEC-C domain-containing protein, partial [Chlamydiales bacterium]|nr:SEC-C domain-containing protein [Chlamydiales bacterium]